MLIEKYNNTTNRSSF